MNKGIYFAAFTALLWGFLAIAVKVALDFAPPFTISWVRFIIAFVFLLLFYLLFDSKKLAIYKAPPLAAIIAGIALGANYLGFIIGIHHTSPSIGQVFIQTGPVLLAISGFVFFKEKVSVRQAVGLLMVLIGMLVFYREQIINIAGGMAEYKKGVLFVLFGALSWSVYAISQKIAVRKHHPMQLNLIIFGLPAVYLIPMVDFEAFKGLSLNQWLLLLFLGLNTLGAYGSLAFALKYLEANKISVIITLNPIITFLCMAWLSQIQVNWIKPESFTVLTILGALIVLSGVILTVIRKKKGKISKSA